MRRRSYFYRGMWNRRDKGIEGIKELSKPIVFDEKGFCEERSDAAICLIKSGCQIKGQ